jgi:hypothetical protein
MYCRQFDHEWRLVPEDVHFLMQPIRLFVANFQIEMKENTSKYEAHFVVSEAGTVIIEAGEMGWDTNFLPIQLRGPAEKGFRASFRSEPYCWLPSGRKRSGTKLSGSLKLVRE